jgi:hypothetical protein
MDVIYTVNYLTEINFSELDESQTPPNKVL